MEFLNSTKVLRALGGDCPRDLTPSALPTRSGGPPAQGSGQGPSVAIDLGLNLDPSDFDEPDSAFSRTENIAFMSRHVAKNFQVFSTLTNQCRRLHATWTRHENGPSEVAAIL
jgi:hypothetical protein